MKTLRKLGLVLVALLLPACSTWQCAVGQTVNQSIRHSNSDLVAAVAFLGLCVVLVLIAGAIFSGGQDRQ